MTTQSGRGRRGCAFLAACLTILGLAGVHPEVGATGSGAGVATVSIPRSSEGLQPLQETPVINGVGFKLSMQNGVVLVCKLTITGQFFEPGCVVLIDGQPAPKMLFMSSNKVVAKGGAKLKKMLPKGRAVALTVRNPGGQTSTPWTFTR